MRISNIRKVAITLFLTGICYSAQSQVLISLLLGDKLNTGKIEFGLEFGFNSARITGFESKNNFNNWNLGFYFDIRPWEDRRWQINTGVLVKSTVGMDELTVNDLQFLGVDSVANTGTYSQRINHFYVPIQMKYFFVPKFFLNVGVQVGLRYKAQIVYESKVEDLDVEAKFNNKDDTNIFDFGFTGGLGYRVQNKNGMNIGARYYYGITNVFKGVDGRTNSVIYLYIDIPIGKGKAASQRED